MPSIEHEDIVDDVRLASGLFLAECASVLDCDTLDIGWMAAEAFFFDAVYRINRQSGKRGQAADFYMTLEDGAGPILVEVGKMPDGKWNHLEWIDGAPVRVLRVGFDRSVSLVRPRGTNFELAYFRWIELSLAGIAPSIEVSTP